VVVRRRCDVLHEILQLTNPYSSRKARTGSSRAAHLAGRMLAAAAHPTMSAATARYVNASVAATSYRMP